MILSYCISTSWSIYPWYCSCLNCSIMWKPNNQTSPILPHNASNGRYTPSKSSGSLWVYHMLPCYPHFALIVSVLGFLTFSTKPLLLCFRFLFFFFSSSLPELPAEVQNGVAAWSREFGNLKLYQFSPGICTRNLVMCVCVCAWFVFSHVTKVKWHCHMVS